ncbi:MAG: hypothetical protein JW729_08880 [Bacteroidales bacterium]|nr:hypothetical protein [Bacteroidales bacterium]
MAILNKRNGFILFLLITVFLSACSLERKMAMDFMKKKNNYKGSILVVPPYHLNFLGSKEDYIRTLLPDSLKSARILTDYVLDEVSDSILIENYLNTFISKLTLLGFDVYLANDLDLYKQASSPAYVIRFAQVELEEAYYEYLIDEEIFGSQFKKAFDLTKINLRTWFEFEARDTAWNKVFYRDDAVTDDLTGEYYKDKLRGNPVLYYEIDSLKVEKVYKLANEAGALYAEYLNDYLMNSHIKTDFPEGRTPSIYFHYDSELKMLFPFTEGFQEIGIQKK